MAVREENQGELSTHYWQSAVHISSHFMLLFASHALLFADEETNSERVSNLLKDAQQMGGRPGIQIQAHLTQA